MLFFKRLGKYRRPEASEKQLKIKVQNSQIRAMNRDRRHLSDLD